MKSYLFSTREQAFAALIRAPLVPAALLFAWDAALRTMHHGPLAIVGAALLSVYVLAVMETVSLLVGGAILALIWKRVSFNVLFTSALGGLIAILPLLALLALPIVPGLNAWSDGKPTVVDGHKTEYGRWRDIQTLATVFAFGMVGGASFWWFGKPRTIDLGRQ